MVKSPFLWGLNCVGSCHFTLTSFTLKNPKKNTLKSISFRLSQDRPCRIRPHRWKSAHCAAATASTSQFSQRSRVGRDLGIGPTIIGLLPLRKPGLGTILSSLCRLCPYAGVLSSKLRPECRACNLRCRIQKCGQCQWPPGSGWCSKGTA